MDISGMVYMLQVHDVWSGQGGNIHHLGTDCILVYIASVCLSQEDEVSAKLTTDFA